MTGLGETLDLFATDPLSLARGTEGVFRDDFVGYLADNMHIYTEFERRALQVARFRDHYSGYAIYEVMRHDTAIGELGSEYKLNNLFRADMCRLFGICNPAHAGLFEYRERARRAA